MTAIFSGRNTELEFQQAFIDRAQLTDTERFVVDEDQVAPFFIHVTGHQVEPQREETIRQLVPCEEASVFGFLTGVFVIHRGQKQSAVV